ANATAWAARQRGSWSTTSWVAASASRPRTCASERSRSTSSLARALWSWSWRSAREVPVPGRAASGASPPSNGSGSGGRGSACGACVTATMPRWSGCGSMRRRRPSALRVPPWSTSRVPFELPRAPERSDRAAPVDGPAITGGRSSRLEGALEIGAQLSQPLEPCSFAPLGELRQGRVDHGELSLPVLSQADHHLAERLVELDELVPLPQPGGQAQVALRDVPELPLHLEDGPGHLVGDDDARGADGEHEHEQDDHEGPQHAPL